MTTERKQAAALYVDRTCRQWIVRDPDGRFWILPSVEDPWTHRVPTSLTAERDLEPVPGHYMDLLGLPF